MEQVKNEAPPLMVGRVLVGLAAGYAWSKGPWKMGAAMALTAVSAAYVMGVEGHSGEMRQSMLAVGALSTCLLGASFRIAQLKIPVVYSTLRAGDLFGTVSAIRWLTFTGGMLLPASTACFSLTKGLWNDESWAKDEQYLLGGFGWWTRGMAVAAHGNGGLDGDLLINAWVGIESQNRETYLRKALVNSTNPQIERLILALPESEMSLKIIAEALEDERRLSVLNNLLKRGAECFNKISLFDPQEFEGRLKALEAKANQSLGADQKTSADKEREALNKELKEIREVYGMVKTLNTRLENTLYESEARAKYRQASQECTNLDQVSEFLQKSTIGLRLQNLVRFFAEEVEENENDEDAFTALSLYYSFVNVQQEQWVAALGIDSLAETEVRLEELGLRTVGDLKAAFIIDTDPTEQSVFKGLQAYVKAKAPKNGFDYYVQLLSTKETYKHTPQALASLAKHIGGALYLATWALVVAAQTRRAPKWVMAGVALGIGEQLYLKREIVPSDLDRIPHIHGSLGSIIGGLRISLLAEHMQSGWLGGRSLPTRASQFGERTASAQNRVIFSETALSGIYSWADCTIAPDLTLFTGHLILGRALVHTARETGSSLWRRVVS